MRRIALAAVPPVLLVLAGTAAHAAWPSAEQIVACTPDYLRLCAHVPLTDPAGVGACMCAHRAALGRACRDAFKGAKACPSRRS